MGWNPYNNPSISSKNPSSNPYNNPSVSIRVHYLHVGSGGVSEGHIPQLDPAHRPASHIALPPGSEAIYGRTVPCNAFNNAYTHT